MRGASSIPFKGILGILCIMRLGLADAMIGYDCYSRQANLTTIHLQNLDHEQRETLKSNMQFCSTHPDECAYQYMGGPGYMSLMEHDKLYILDCEPVEVKLEKQDKCYNRLAILKGDQRQFLTPYTHIITKTATELPCDSPLLQPSELESTVYKVVPRPEGSASISRLKRETKLTWHYEEIPNLASSGIYTQHQIQDLQDRQQNPEKFNPPPVLEQRFPDANGNIPGVIYPHRDDSNDECQWYSTWNTYSVLALLVSVSVFSIVVTIFIMKQISNRPPTASKFGSGGFVTSQHGIKGYTT